MLIHKSITLFTLIIVVSSDFSLQMPITKQSQLVTQVQLENKQVKMAINLKSPTLSVCCRPNRSIFQIIHNFLLNPFFQINQYACPDTPQFSQQSQVLLPSIGLLSIQYNLQEAPSCKNGVLGLSKNSVFLKYLPINFHVFAFTIHQRENVQNQKIALNFGEISNNDFKAENVFASSSDDFWMIQAHKITLGSFIIASQAEIVLVSDLQYFSLPKNIYDKIKTYFLDNWVCSSTQPQALKCLCNNGISRLFPSFKIKLRQNLSIGIDPSLYMSIDSNICTIILTENSNSLDTKLYISISMFEDKTIYLDPHQNQIIIEDISSTAHLSFASGLLDENDFKGNSGKIGLWDLPLQLILNCAVILLLCMFVSLLIVEIIKRISGLSEVDEEEGFGNYLLGIIGRYR